MSDEIGNPPQARHSGWYPSPAHPGYGEYWDGTAWTGIVRAETSVAPDDSTTIRTSPVSRPEPVFGAPTKAHLPPVTWVGIVLGGIWVLIGLGTSGFSGALIAASTLAFFTAIYVIASGRPSWLLLGSKKAGALLLAGALVTTFVGGSIAPRPTTSTVVNLAGDPQQSTKSSSPTAPAASESPAPDTSPSAQSTNRKPTVTTKKVVEVQELPFAQTTVDDPALPAGTSQIRTAGVPGKQAITYQVTMTDGVETARSIISKVTTVNPVAQVTANGTYIAPIAAPPAPAPAAPSGCDPNYGGCVPIDSDVDCGGGSGNGPSYLYETVPVIGNDVYDLDRDHDGIACD